MFRSRADILKEQDTKRAVRADAFLSKNVKGQNRVLNAKNALTIAQMDGDPYKIQLAARRLKEETEKLLPENPSNTKHLARNGLRNAQRNNRRNALKNITRRGACFKDPDVTRNTSERHLCDKDFTRRIIEEKAVLDEINTTDVVIGKGSYGAVRSAEIRMHTEAGSRLMCVGVYKVATAKSDALARDIVNEIGCYARLQRKPCLSKGLFIKLSLTGEKTVMEHYITDLEHLFSANVKPQTNPLGIDLNQFVKAIAYQMLTGLRSMHEERIMHRDIKPANTFMSHNGEVVLADFGLSHHTAVGFRNPQTFYQTAGTPTYMPPETFLHHPRFDSKVDIWSIGTTLYEFLSGRFFIDGDWQRFINGIPRANPAPYFQRQVDVMMSRIRLGETATSLLRGLLDTNPQTRFSAAQALEHRWFDGVSLNSARDTVLKSLNGLCLITAKKKVNATKRKGNAGVVTNVDSRAFMRIEESPGWRPSESKERNDAVEDAFQILVTSETRFPIIKFLHAVELLDRCILRDRAVIQKCHSWIYVCAVLADLLSEESGDTLTSTGIARFGSVSTSTIEQVERDIIRILGGDIYPLPDGLVRGVCSLKPMMALDFIDDFNRVASASIRASESELRYMTDSITRLTRMY